MNSRIVGLAVVAVLSAAGAAMGEGQIWFGTDPSSTSGRYNGTDASGGAFVITKKNGYHGIMGGNRTAGDEINTSNVNPNKRLVASGVEESFLSFCIERNEYITNSGTYWTEISTTALYGGQGGQQGGQGDPLSSRTALLYSQFRQIGNEGVVPNTLFNGLIADGVWNASDSSALQLAIWKSEDENVNVGSNPLAAALFNWATGAANGSLYGVRVLRLWQNRSGTDGNYTYSGEHQDQLTLIPLPPAAWAGLSTLAGVGFVGYIRRRKNTAQ